MRSEKTAPEQKIKNKNNQNSSQLKSALADVLSEMNSKSSVQTEPKKKLVDTQMPTIRVVKQPVAVVEDKKQEQVPENASGKKFNDDPLDVKKIKKMLQKTARQKSPMNP